MTIGKWFSWSIWIKVSAILLTILVFGLVVPAVAQPSGCPTGMTGYWKFDEVSGGPYDDFFGSNNATCTNCPATVIGKLGSGLDFDGTNDRVDIADDNSFDWSTTTSFTIEFWMRSSGCNCTTPVGGYTCNQVIVGRSATASGGWWIGVNCETGNVGKLRCYFANVDMYSNVTVANDVWHHVVFQYDNSAGQYRMYIDGSLDKSALALGADRAGTVPLQIGYFSTGFQYYGMLDEFAVYNQTLTLSDIQNHYNSGNGQSYCSANQTPVVTDIPGETIAEGGTFVTINLDDYISDGDHTDAEMTWTYSGNSQLTVSIVNRVATITAPNAEWSGSETITFTATDPLGAFDSDDATFTVTAVNDPPTVTDIPGQTIAEGGTFATISLDDYVSDADHTDAQIEWTYSGNTQLTVSIVNRVATITTPNGEWSGSETITFTATDPLGAFDSDDATFTVTAVNDAPIVMDIPGQTIVEGGTFATIALDDYISDADHTDAEMNWTYLGHSQLVVSIVNRVATITAPNAEWSGNETITFTATDPLSAFDSDDATFTVTAVNDPPVMTDIPGQTIAEGGSFATINLDDYVSDADHSDGEMNWTYSGNSELTVSIVNRVATITTPGSTWTGSETITFTATDPEFASDSDGATFAVLSQGCPDGMIHYWQLNDASVPPLEDSYGSTDATCSVCPTPVAGLVGSAQEFDRLTDLVTVPDDGTFDWTAASSYTIEFWLNKSTGCGGSAQPNNEVVVGRSGGGWWVGVMCESGGHQTKVRAYFGATTDLYSTTSVTDGDWHHVAFVRDNTAGEWRMYIDGNLEVTQVSAGRALAASDPLTIGWFNGPDPGKYRLGAILDELALYSSALSEVEIDNHYSLGLSGLGYCQLGVPPLFTSTPDTAALGNRSYTYDAEATGSPEPIFTLTTYPAGMTIDSLTGVINWTPGATGAYPVSISAINAAGVDFQSYTIIVSALAPLITSAPVTSAFGGEPYEYDVEASAQPAATYFVFGTPPFGLPPGLTFNATTGLISWPNPQPGTHPISVQAVNVFGTDLQSYVLEVTPVAPLITSSPLLVARTGSLYRYQVHSNGSPAPFFYLDIAPSGMEIDSVSGEITWLPTVAANFPVKVRAANTAGDDAQVYVIAVAEGITECTPTMLHYWRLNELSGPSYANFLTPLTAQCVGACPTAVSGNVDGGQRFGAGNVGLQVADNGSFDWISIEDFAVEFWMRRDIAPAIDSNEVIVGRWGPQWWIGINHDGGASDIGKLRCCMSGVNLLSNSVVNDDFWHHVVASRSSGVLSLYLDGELQSSAPSTTTLAADDPLTMGYLNTGSPILGYLRYKGVLDEVALHSDDLPLTVVTAHYNNGIGIRYCARCGDCDANGNLTISDVVALIGYIFSGGAAPEPLLTGDTDCSNMVTISDVVYMINFIFSGGSIPCANCK